jgi:general secretion pathway protein D
MNSRSSERSGYGKRALLSSICFLSLAAVHSPAGAQSTAASVASSKQAKSTAAKADKSKKQSSSTKKSTTATRKPSSKTGVKIVPMQGGRGRTRGINLNDFPGMSGGGDDFGGGAPPGGGGFGFGGRGGGSGLPGRMNGPFSFDFRGSDIVNVLRFYAQMSGTTITAAPELSGPVTVIAPRPVTLDEAFLILQSVLNARGFTAVQKGDVISIVSVKNAITISPDVNIKTTDPLNTRDQVMTQVIPVSNVDAETLAKDLAPLASPGAQLVGSAGTNSLIITDTADNVRRFIKLVGALDQGSVNQSSVVYQLKRADASVVADTVNNLYKQITTRGRSTPQQNPGQPVFPGQPQQPTGTPAVVAVADARTNSVIVVASTDNQKQIGEMISKLDDDETAALETHMRKMTYANAIDVANLVNGILTTAHGAQGGGGGSPFQNRIFGGGGFFGGFGGFGGGQQNNQSVTTQSTDPLASLNADPRTNTVIITAAADRVQHINELIDKIDVPVPAEPTTFVVPLKNANAADVAYALSLAFNTSSTNGGNQNNPFLNLFGNSNSSNGTSHTAINRQPGQNNGLGLSRAATPHGVSRAQQAPPGPPAPPDGSYQVQDPSLYTQNPTQPQLTQPQQPTQEPQVPLTAADTGQAGATRQFGGRFGGFGGFGGQQSRTNISTSQTYGRGQNGGYANLLQLQGNVYVTPSPDGDSLIITTTPDNMNAVRDIVNQLDVVPRQVMIDVIIAEVTLTSDQKLGLNVNGMLSRLLSGTNTATLQANLPAGGFPNTYDANAQGGQINISGTNYGLLLQALTSDNKIKVLSTPQVFTRNNQQAEIDVTEEVPYISGQVTGVLTTTVSNNVQYLNVGITLNVTPRITREGLVTIDVTQEASDLLGYVTLGTGSSAVSSPETNDRYTDTSVSVQDGETVVLGGLMKSQKTLTINKVPLLGDIPLVGQFFRSREKQLNNVELLVFLTPHVVNTRDEARALMQQRALHMRAEQPELDQQQPNVVPGAKTSVKVFPLPDLTQRGTMVTPSNPNPR